MGRNPEQTTLFYPFYPTDYGRCTLIHPMIAFDPKHENSTFEELRKNYVANTSQGVLFGKDNGLTFLADAEVYSSFSLRHKHQLILALFPRLFL